MIWYHAPIRNGNNGPRCFRGKLFTHLMADSDEELTVFAGALGMKRQWLQHGGTAESHFDVTGSRLKLLQASRGAVEVDRAEYIRRLYLRSVKALDAIRGGECCAIDKTGFTSWEIRRELGRDIAAYLKAAEELRS